LPEASNNIRQLMRK